MHFVTGDGVFGFGVFGFGVGVLIKMDIDFTIVEASAMSELRGDMLHFTCGSHPNDPADTSPKTNKTVWAVGQITTVALEITIFWVLDSIEFDYQHEWNKNTDNGPCPLLVVDV